MSYTVNILLDIFLIQCHTCHMMFLLHQVIKSSGGDLILLPPVCVWRRRTHPNFAVARGLRLDAIQCWGIFVWRTVLECLDFMRPHVACWLISIRIRLLPSSWKEFVGRSCIAWFNSLQDKQNYQNLKTGPSGSKYCGALHVVNFFLRKSCYLSSINAGVFCKPKCLLVQLSSEKKV